MCCWRTCFARINRSIATTFASPATTFRFHLRFDSIRAINVLTAVSTAEKEVSMIKTDEQPNTPTAVPPATPPNTGGLKKTARKAGGVEVCLEERREKEKGVPLSAPESCPAGEQDREADCPAQTL